MAGDGDEAGLVPGRECGTCTVCCSALPIDSDELQKLPGEVCTNCTGHGCAIYNGRPRTCRGFYCGWRLLPQLDDDWRPDRSGVLIVPQNENVPDRFALREGIEFMILGGVDAVRRPGFVETLMSFVRNGIATFIAIPGPVGHFATRVFINEVLNSSAARSDGNGAVAMILRILEASKTHRFEKASFTRERSG